tara:strand:+ start:352 stop:513 length:162 start_codon:yes stop_codon:yes gene_type:complete
MSWFEGVRKGLNCPKCGAKGTFSMKPGSYSNRAKKTGRAKYECSECGFRQVIG